MSTLKVDGIRSNGDTSGNDTITLADNTTCTANITNRQNRNLIINGAMQVAQRGTSSTTNGFGTVDRFIIWYDNTDEAPTQAQADVASGTTPYTLGFRKSYKITNGNQTSGAGTDDVIQFATKLEAQDIANSGWNYTSASSFITLSFWVKSSVAQTFYVNLRTDDGTSQNFPFSTGSLSADTWTKVTQKIPGNANLVFNNDNGEGLEIIFTLYRGTDTTGSVTLGAWAAHNNSTRVPDFGTANDDWYLANDATFEITGLQLEVSDYATDFEHRSYGVEKRLCMRYYQEYKNIQMAGYIPDNNARAYALGFNFPVEFRAAPTLTISNTGSSSGQMIQDGETGGKITTLVSTGMTSYNAEINVNLHADMTNYRPAVASSAGWTTNETKYMFNGEL